MLILKWIRSKDSTDEIILSQMKFIRWLSLEVINIIFDNLNKNQTNFDS